MVKADNMTPEEALEYLKDQQRRTLERQQDFTRKKEAEGNKRLTAWVTADAWEALQALKNDIPHSTNASVVSDALIAYRETLATPEKPQKQPVKKPVSNNKEATKEDRAKLADEAKTLKDKGHSLQQIADIFVGKNYVNARGKVAWSKSSIKRLTD